MDRYSAHDVNVNSSFNILSLDGGGYLGLATVAFLAECERHFNAKCHEKFQLFAGTSTGAIIALALAFGKNAKEIADLYEKHGPKIFGPWYLRRFRTFKSLFLPMYSSAHLESFLYEVFGRTTLKDIAQQGKFVLVPAHSITRGAPVLFKTGHSPNLTRDDQLYLTDVAMASAAAPIYFPTRTIKYPTKNVERFCDGGVFSNQPSLLAYIEALFELKIPPKEINILSVSTPRPTAPKRKRFLLGQGLLGWRTRLIDALLDSKPAIDAETMRRLIAALPGGGGIFERIQLNQVDGLALDRADQWAKDTLRNIGTSHAQQNEVRSRLKSFFC